MTPYDDGTVVHRITRALPSHDKSTCFSPQDLTLRGSGEYARGNYFKQVSSLTSMTSPMAFNLRADKIPLTVIGHLK
jgi:hypothetical protein